MSGVTIEHQRRRLTVSQADVATSVATLASAKVAEDLERAGLKELFASVEGKRAVCITGTTDQELTKKRSFTEKDSEVLVPEGQSAEENEQWVRTLGLGWSCRKGMKPESPNQDSYSLLIVEGSFILIGVYDGHGAFGHDASNIARRVVVREFISHKLQGVDPGKALTDAFHTCQQELMTEKNRDFSTSGTTCTMAHLDLQTDELTIAHVGDSRAVLARRPSPSSPYATEDLSEDHKPNLEREKARIESADPPGRVIFDGYYNHRVFAQGSALPGLNMSRALGDIIGNTEAGISATPDVRVVSLKEERAASSGSSAATLLVCTDGVWEFISSEQAFEYIAPHAKIGMQKCIDDLAKESWDAWMKDSDNEISDDITAVCLCLITPSEAAA
mmetsp:Transcript_57714/g.137332  ORF Transcript_57714/g.137332 Transcript_57714/m.137332 type:complete len:389 (+) Transcript_57714:133-1299(+)|eukprot:CAMPEP_0178426026 /NCGR_PEP_ID=MMETSP0689_2-20121128/29025_1 /TAXON_ID=160604 /ORGANISM="Amphidinium massartii, Strain CS-259" /LENGTH=388 /DNA_ID=CAMNT_0020047705 /DNA_START=97 /DNA_END=1263 /DNA_ORIENTATION=+